MPEAAVLDAPRGGDLPDSPFLKQLIQLIRAEDSFGNWEGKSDAELLAIFLRTGTQGMNVIELADVLLRDFGSLRKLFSANQQEFSSLRLHLF